MFRSLALLAAVAALSACSPHRADAAPGDAQANATAGAAFLAKNATQPGVITLPSGLQYKAVRQGPAGGIHPRPQDTVKVQYEGALLDGKVFDSSYKTGQPAVFTLGDLIPGWIEGIQRMKPGDEFMLWVPAKLGYGDGDAGPIPGGSTLVFKIELLGVLPASGQG
jgi:peptidylprolyl isomerase/FKBP-type peptidyl-prolyl cis-trans isomerase FklB